MAATVTTYVYTGAAPGSGAAATQLRFKNADDNTIDTNNPPVVPAAGNNYSWWKTIALYCSVAPSAAINNLKLYTENFRLFLCSEDDDMVVAEDIGDLDSLTQFDTITPLVQAFEIDALGDYAHAVRYYNDRWKIYDIRNLAALSEVFSGQVEKTTCDPGDFASKYLTDVIAYSSTYALLLGTSYCWPGTAHASINVWVQDISTPSTPVETATDLTETFGYAYHVAGVVKGTTLYISVFTATSSSACGIISADLASLPAVTFLDEISISGSFTTGWTDIVAMAAQNYAYASHSMANQIRIVNITTPSVLTHTNYTITDPRGLAILNDNFLYVCQPSLNQITVLDISTPTSPSVAGTLTDATDLNGAAGIMLHPEQDVAFVTCPGSDRITVIDLTVPQTPTVRSSFTSATVYDKVFGMAGLAGDGIGWKGCTLYVGNQTTATYVQATGDEDNGDEMVAAHSQISSKTDFFSFTRSSPKSVSGSIGAATGRVSDYVVLQPAITATADAGQSNLETVYWEYDEV